MGSAGRGAGVLSMLMLVSLTALAPAEAGDRGVHGTVVTPSPKASLTGPTADPARCAWLLEGKDSQGVLGYMVTLTRAEGDGRHRFSLAAGTLASGVPALWGDFDVVFYSRLGTCGGGARSTGMFASGPHEPRESGRIPKGSRYALVLLSYTPDSPICCYYYWVPFVWPNVRVVPLAAQPFTMQIR